MTEKPSLPPDLVEEVMRLAPQLTWLDHYCVLGVAESASESELKAAYVRALARFHPGRWHATEGANLHKRMEAIFTRATEAYEVLRDPTKRLDYDRALAKVRGITRASVLAPPPAPPVIAPVPVEPAPIEPARPRPPGAPTDRILVVEDDEALRRMLARVLDELGEVQTAADGAEALALIANDPLPRLIVTDVMMPNLDGLELARRVKADPRTKHIPIVMLTAKQGSRDLIDGVNAGARIYVTKPFKVDELRAKVKKALGR